jgi:hypothetical protein
MRVNPITGASAPFLFPRPMNTKTVRVYRVTRRLMSGPSLVFADERMVTANNHGEAVNLYCASHGMGVATLYGTHLWKAKKTGAIYLIRCDSTASGSDRNRV